MLCIKPSVFVQDVSKLLTGKGIEMDEDMRKGFKGSHGSNLAASIEAMKTRRAAQLMTKALRQFNPKLAKALIDDRDDVTNMIPIVHKNACTLVGLVFSPPQVYLEYTFVYLMLCVHKRAHQWSEMRVGMPLDFYWLDRSIQQPLKSYGW